MRKLVNRAGDDRGATIMEFGLITPALMLMLLGFFDVAHSAFTSAILQGAVQYAARASTLETGSSATQITNIDEYVQDRVLDVTGEGATFVFERNHYSDFALVGKPENFTDRVPLNNRYDAGECFEDVNGNGAWDADPGRSGQGGAQDATLYEVTVSYPRLIPMGGLLGWSNTKTMTATTVLRNQPYRNQTRPSYALCT